MPGVSRLPQPGCLLSFPEKQKHVACMPSPLSDTSFYRRWVWANGWSELAGLGGSLLLAWLGSQVLSLNESSLVVVLGSVLAAVVLGTFLEGVVVGFAQARVLRHRLSNLAPRAWIIATAVGAATAWLLGMLPSAMTGLASSAEAPPPETFEGPLQYVLAAALGLVLGPILGLPQWVVLRRHIPGAGWWIGANALAWAVGMPLVFLGMGLLSEEATILQIIATVLTSCLAAGLSVGAIHGLVLVRLLRRARIPAT